MPDSGSSTSVLRPEVNCLLIPVRKDSGRTGLESVETLNSRSCKRVTRFTIDVSRAMAAQAGDDLKAQEKAALPQYRVAADQTYASSASATSQS